ncbi:hypothetical protein ACFLXC_01070 [Chloroflexota bacterium]
MMVKYVCYKCKIMFELPESPLSGCPDKTSCQLVKCPQCNGTQTEKLPAWIPLGFNLDYYFAPLEWEYKCKQCTKVFKLPVPSSQKEESGRQCPTCGSPDIERLTQLCVEAPYYNG